MKSFKTNRYQTRTVNIKSKSFLRYPFVTSVLALVVIYCQCLTKVWLVKTFDRLLDSQDISQPEILRYV